MFNLRGLLVCFFITFFLFDINANIILHSVDKNESIQSNNTFEDIIEKPSVIQISCYDHEKVNGRDIIPELSKEDWVVDLDKKTVTVTFEFPNGKTSQIIDKLIKIDEKEIIFQQSYDNAILKFEYGTGQSGKVSFVDSDWSEYHCLDYMRTISNLNGEVLNSKDLFIVDRVVLEKKFKFNLLGNCINKDDSFWTDANQVLMNYLGYALQLISIYNFETDMSKNNMKHCNNDVFKGKVYTKIPFDPQTNEIPKKWGDGQSIIIEDFSYRDGEFFMVPVIDVSNIYKCMRILFADFKVNDSNVLGIYLEKNDGRHVPITSDDASIFLKNYCDETF